MRIVNGDKDCCPVIIKGQKGDKGDAATITIGTVTTVDPYDPAEVINVGDENDAILNFRLPMGVPGNTGNAATIAVGTVTRLSPDADPTVENVGNEHAAVLDFGIPAGGGDGLTDDIKQALLQIARKVVYEDAGGPAYYAALHEALYPVTSIDAVYTQSGTVYTTDTLSSLKSDLVVAATYGDGTTATIPAVDYTLSGTLTAGTSTITVTYGGMTDTFTVTVTQAPKVLVSIDATYTQSGTVYTSTTLDSLKSDLVVTATYDDSSTAVIPAADYTLSGTLTAGTSTITAAYGGETDTFTVSVTAVALTSIDAVYTQSGTVYTTDTLNSLKTDLVVTASYNDGSTATVASADYTLSGTLTAGTSTITVTYGGMTDTFTVTVTAATLTSITAVYTQSGTVYTSSTLDSLKADLVVTATYSDSSTATVPGTDYTLSGTLTAGTSTITVTYGGMTDTFTVTVTAVELSSITAVYTQSGTVYDTAALNSLKTDLVVTATYNDSSTAIVPSTDYTLSGTLTVGTSTVTVTYSGKTTTFTVTVSAAPVEELWIKQVGNTGNVAGFTYAPFIMPTSRYYYNYGRKITAIEADFTAAGTITVGYCSVGVPSGAYDSSTVTYVQTFTVPASGVQKLTLTTPLELPSGYSLAIGKTTDTATFKYGGTLINGYFYKNNSNVWAVSNKTLGVNVYREETPIGTLLYSWDLTQSLTDTVGGITAITTGSRDSSGLHFTAGDQYVDFGAVYDKGRIYELDVVSHDQKTGGGLGNYGRMFAVDTDTDTSSGVSSFSFSGSKRIHEDGGTKGYAIYRGTGLGFDSQVLTNMDDAAAGNDYNDAFFNGKTIRIHITTTGLCEVSCKPIGGDETMFIVISAGAFNEYTAAHVLSGSSGTSVDYLYNTTYSGFRVYGEG